MTASDVTKGLSLIEEAVRERWNAASAAEPKHRQRQHSERRTEGVDANGSADLNTK